MRFRRLLGAGTALAMPALGVAMLVPGASASASVMSVHRHSHTLFVSKHGHDSATCGARYRPCKTIGQAVTNAKPGDTVHVRRGRYHEQVMVTKRLTIAGFHATVNARGLKTAAGAPNEDDAAITVTANRSVIEGLTVRNAYGEGILVRKASHVLITRNVVVHNDLGTPANTQYLECLPAGPVPGDCGEGIHLMSATRSRVVDNLVMHNSGGVLITDEFGPASHNAVVHNLLAFNLYDCGVTIPSHNPGAVSSAGVLQPTVAGVYDNLVRQNVIIGNGTKGEGAGVLIAAPGPTMASYNNRVIDNYIAGNGLAGVTIHSHALPGGTVSGYVSGNVIKYNKIGKNNLAGDAEAGDMLTTGILVWTQASPVTVTIAHNKIRHDHYRVFLNPTSLITVKH